MQGYVIPKDDCEHLSEHVKIEKLKSIGNFTSFWESQPTLRPYLRFHTTIHSP